MIAELIEAARERGINPEAFADDRALAIALLERFGVRTSEPADPWVGNFAPFTAQPAEYLMRRALYVSARCWP